MQHGRDPVAPRPRFIDPMPTYTVSTSHKWRTRSNRVPTMLGMYNDKENKT